MLLRTVESLRIGGEDREGLPAQWRHRAEGALVEAGDPIGSMPVGQHCKRGVGKAQLEVAVATRQVAGRSQLLAVEAIDDEGARREVIEEGDLDVDTQPSEDQVVGLGDRQLRGDELPSLAFEERD